MIVSYPLNTTSAVHFKTPQSRKQLKQFITASSLQENKHACENKNERNIKGMKKKKKKQVYSFTHENLSQHIAVMHNLNVQSRTSSFEHSHQNFN